jgi:hypothetical protein
MPYEIIADPQRLGAAIIHEKRNTAAEAIRCAIALMGQGCKAMVMDLNGKVFTSERFDELLGEGKIADADRI